ncbi:hypothetical protein ACE6H2_013087 [Prunus campanulata]
MEVCCDLQVDVNGEEVFMVDKKTLASFSGRFSKLFGKLKGTSRSLKVIFHDFPGGAEGFELMTRFCYNNGTIEITPSNIVLLYCIAHFMEMDGDGSGRLNILSQTEKSLEGISFWTWPNLVVALKQCQDLLPASNSSSILEKVLDCLIAKLFCPFVTSTYASSSEHLSFQFSSARSSHCLKTNCSQTTWWVEDLMFLSINLIEKVIRRMMFQKLDHSTIFKFLFHYHQSKSMGATTPGEKCKITEVAISLLYLLDRSSLSCKRLFKIYQLALSLKISKLYKNKLENMIGSQLDQATIDYVLVPSPRGKKYVYDVSLVLRFVKSFLLEKGCHFSQSRLKRVSKLMDSYLAEVAPDTYLNPSKFAALAMSLPDSARESHDRLYQAIGVYFKRHADLFEEEKMSICCALNYDKLSAHSLKHLTQNIKFPPRGAVEAFTTEQSKLRSLLHKAYNLKTLDSLLIHTDNEIKHEKQDTEHIIPIYTKKLDLPTEAEKLRAHLQTMHWKTLEMGNTCGTMEMQMAAIMKSRLSFRGSIQYLPKLFP